MSDQIYTINPRETWPQLTEIPSPPKKLYVKGTLPDSSQVRYLTVVGPRHHSSYGKQVCLDLIAQLSGWPVVIVSGLAIGIDAWAHRAAMQAGLNTLAWPGSGLNSEVLYPASNFALAEEITRSNGALISEFSPETRAAKYTFPKRNRLMAGMAQAVLIIEARQRSGTLITARLALDYNREVLAVPGPITSSSSAGTNELIKSGAMAVTSGQDILQILGFEPETHKLDETYFDLTENETKVMTALKQRSTTFDHLVHELKMPSADLNTALSGLEIKGLIRRQGEELDLKENSLF